MTTIFSHTSFARRLSLQLVLVTTLAGCAYHPMYPGSHSDYNAQPGYYQVGGAPVESVQHVAPPARTDMVRPENLTFGAVKRNLRIGASSQADVINVLGSPNNMTINGQGREIWVYDRINTQIDTSDHRVGSGVKFGLGGLGSVIGAGILFDAGDRRNDSTMVSATKTLTVVLEFDERFILRDMLVREGRY